MGDLLAAVREVGADVEPGLLAKLHLDDALVPACSVSVTVNKLVESQAGEPSSRRVAIELRDEVK